MSNEIQRGGVQAGGAVEVSPFALQQQAGGALATITSNAAVVETMASIYIAKQFPRNLAEVKHRMEDACSFLSLAAAATYSYKRGNQTVTGPSIRLAECLLACYGNAEAGWREVSRHRDPVKGCGVSECVAYAFDKETNTRKDIMFSVPHWRDTKTKDDKGRRGYELTDDRDIYEVCANMAARRVRSCILAILPAWLKEDALDEVGRTIAKFEGKEKLPDMVSRMVSAFEGMGVSVAQLEVFLGHAVSQCTKPELRGLRDTFNAIQEGAVRMEDYFPPQAAPPVEPQFSGGADAPAPANFNDAQAQGVFGAFGEEV